MDKFVHYLHFYKVEGDRLDSRPPDIDPAGDSASDPPYTGAVLGKNIWGPGPSSFGRQQRLSEITIEPITSTSRRHTVSSYPEENWGTWARFGGPVPPGPNIEPPLPL